MSSCSRGLFGFLRLQSLRPPCSIRTSILAARPAPTNARFLSSTCLRRLAQGRQAFASPGYRVARSSDPVLRYVETSKQSVVLYRAPRKILYTWGVCAFGASVIVGGLAMLDWRYQLPADLPFFVGPTYTVLAFICFGLSIYVFTAPLRRCTLIEVIPNYGGHLQLRIQSRFFPFVRPKTVLADIGEATISEKLNPVVRELKEARRARKAHVREGLEDLFIVRRIWEVMARWTEREWTSFFNRFKFMVLRFGNVELEVGGAKWKIDCEGYLLEDGKAIDRIISSY